MEKTGDEACRNCKFWAPKYFQAGICQREGFAHAKLWSLLADSRIITSAGFLCLEYEKLPDNDKDTI